MERVALLSIRSSPLEPPGSGDAGGMNVYVDALARTLARRGVAVDVFTRADGARVRSVPVAPGYAVVEVPASGFNRAEVVGEFARGVVKWSAEADASYDVVHSHYWLSGWAGAIVHDLLGTPLAISFHTLGRIQEAAGAPGEPRESLARIAAETEVVALAGCVIASTPAEVADLVEHYQAAPERLCLSPPGVDHGVFTPGDRAEARAALELDGGPIVALVGRVHALKGVDVAVRAVARIPGCRLLVVGGASGPDGESLFAELGRLAADVAPGRIHFRGPMDHAAVVTAYRAADAVIVPSRAESFGLVALEAQAVGVPVVAARVGGLPHVVVDGRSGFLVSGHDPVRYAAALERFLLDPPLADRVAAGALANAARFSWDATVDRLLELYRGLSR